MQQLLQFLYKYRTFILLVLLEGICFWMIVKSNSYQAAKYFTSANRFVASITSFTDQTVNYFGLVDENKSLAEENVKLRQYILNLTDSVFVSEYLSDSSRHGIKAKVIDNSLFFRNNYLTINQGSKHGVLPGMGVISSSGVVGQVLHATENYATVISMLHTKSMISAHHKATGTLCSVIWKGDNPQYANLEFLPRHISIVPGDSISTSGYNSVYPENQLIGIVSEVHLDDDATFYRVKIALSTNFYSLSYVYILNLNGQKEIDTLNLELSNRYE